MRRSPAECTAGRREPVKRPPARLVVAGTVLVDILLYLDSHPNPGEVRIARGAVVSPGAGYNLLRTAVGLGLPAALLGLVGDGPFGRIVRDSLAELGVPVLLPTRGRIDTGFDVGLVQLGLDSQPSFVGSPGVEVELALEDLRGVRLEPGDAVYVSGYDLWHEGAGPPLAEWLGDLGDDQLVVMDPGPLVAQIPAGRLEAALSRADVVSSNLAEARALAGALDGPELCEAIGGMLRPDAVAVVRAGAQGCWVAVGDGGVSHIRPRPAPPQDTTGAGDVHVATFLTRLARGDHAFEAARWANVAASMAVERLGSSEAPSEEELRREMAKYRGGR